MEKLKMSNKNQPGVPDLAQQQEKNTQGKSCRSLDFRESRAGYAGKGSWVDGWPVFVGLVGVGEGAVLEIIDGGN